MDDDGRRPYRLTGMVGLDKDLRLVATPLTLEGEFSGTLYSGAAEVDAKLPPWQAGDVVPMRDLIPRDPGAKPFRAGALTVEGSFDIELYPGAFERLDEMIRSHPDYCSTCEGFPCQGGHLNPLPEPD